LVNYYNRFAALIHQHGNDEKRARKYSMIALRLAREINDLNLIATSLNELGSIEEHQPNIKAAISLYREAMDLWSQLGVNRYTATPCVNIARCYMKLGNIDSLLFYADKGIELVGDQRWTAVSFHLYELKLTGLEAKKDYEGCYQAMRTYNQLVIELKQKDWLDKLAEVTGELELKSKELELREGRSQIRKSNQIISNDRRQQRILLFVLGLIAIATLTITYFLIRIRKVNKELKHANQSKDVLLKEVHHRVKNNMQVVSSLLDLQSNFAHDQSSRDALVSSRDRINSLALAHQNLYLDDEYESINIAVYLNGVVKAVCSKDIQVNTDFIDELLEIEKAQALGFVLNELLTNSIKHAWEHNVKIKMISIKLVRAEGEWFFYYSDNGKGIGNNTMFLESPTFGVTLIRSFLRRNLKGKIEFGEKPGMNISFSFK
jgi:two-component system, sensor histidine kinase PdtaS